MKVERNAAIRHWNFHQKETFSLREAVLSQDHFIRYFIEGIMASKSGKAKAKSRYTDLHDIIDEIERESDTEVQEDLSDCVSSLDSHFEDVFLYGEDLDWIVILMPLFEIFDVCIYIYIYSGMFVEVPHGFPFGCVSVNMICI